MMFTDDIIKKALNEDIGKGDVTTDAVVEASQEGIGKITTGEAIVIAGLGVAGGVFRVLDPTLELGQNANDGDEVSSGTELLQVKGSLRSMLKAERLALNFLQRLCGIATLTRAYTRRVEGTKTKILDTRKTAPLLRHLDKYAVRMGGGVNHRFGLYDGVMIKDNHLLACGGSVKEAISRVKRSRPKDSIVVEVENVIEIEPAIEAGATRLLLDNMNDDEIRTSVEITKGRVELEVSGGMTLERVERIAKMNVDYISVGALTHSIRAADLSFKIILQ